MTPVKHDPTLCAIIYDAMYNDRARLWHFVLVRRACRNRPLPCSLRSVHGNKAVRCHERQSLISPAQDSLRFPRTGCVDTRRLWDACQQRCLVGILCGERGEGTAKIVFRRGPKPVLAVSHVKEAGVSGQDFLLGPAFRTEMRW